MMTEPSNSAQKLWLEQPVEGIQMSAEIIHKRAAKFERRIRWRNIREYAAAGFGAALMTYFFATAHDVLSRVEYGLFMGAMAWITVNLHRKGSSKTIPAGLDTRTTLSLYRAELERQREAAATVWSWYLAPLVPGLAVLSVGRAIQSPHLLTWIRLAVADGLVAAGLVLVWRLNLRAARCLERTIDELKAAES